MNLFEVKYHDKQEWEAISEIEVLEGLHGVFDQLTLAILDLLQDRRILTPNAMYRIKGDS